MVDYDLEICFTSTSAEIKRRNALRWRTLSAAAAAAAVSAAVVAAAAVAAAAVALAAAAACEGFGASARHLKKNKRNQRITNIIIMINKYNK